MAENLSTSSSENKKKNIIKTVLFFVKTTAFILLLIPLIIFVGGKYSAASTENQVNNWNELRFNEFYSLEKDSVDLFFIGSSHSYCTFDPHIIDDTLGISSYQIGMPQQHPDCTYYTLLEILNYQHPKYIVMEVYWDMLDDEFDLEQVKMLFQVMKNEDLKKEFYDNVFPIGEKIKYSEEIFRYQKDYFAYRDSLLDKKAEEKYSVSKPPKAIQYGTQEYIGKGYTYCDYTMLEDELDKTNQFKGFDAKDWEPDETQLKYLSLIIKKCKEENIKLFFVTAPVANVSVDYIENYNNIHEKIASIADADSIPYIDYNYPESRRYLSLTNDNFRDDAHLNHSGIEIVDSDFCNFLKNHINK
ncbi:MAG: SGNH/GDSL hydrolase family protein [Firmicutes bacterium]|nr:SGNH/GDSL hydrolase family protein [Bacillota bacterium]